VADVWGEAEWQERLTEAFSALPSLSIDFGVMEKAGDVRMVEADFSWSDLGGWLALDEFLEDDGKDNRHRGRLATLDASGNLVFAEDADELVALLGVRHLLVLRAGKRTLVADRTRAEDIKELVRLLEENGEWRDL
jgi:mannose-1-phosphate guanylyltransferase